MDGTKYNLSITTSGENGDHASTNISTSNPAQLADILQLAGMQDAHPIALGDVPQSFEAPAPEEHGSCDVCGGIHEDEEHVVEGDSWDNEPNGATEVVHSPEELSQTGNDLHKVKKTYPKVNGGDNPMALENIENKLRQQFADFLAEDMVEEITEEVELVSPWKKQENDIEIIEEVEEVDEAAGKACKNKKHVENTTENKNMNDLRKLLDSMDSINSDGSTVVTEASTAELQAQIAALQKQLAAQQANEPDPWSPEGQAAMAARQQSRASKEGGRESGPAGSFTDADYDDEGNFIGTPLNVFGKAERHSGPESGPTGSHTDDDYELDADGNVDRTKLKPGREIKVFGKAEKHDGRDGARNPQSSSGKYNPRTDNIRARAEGLQARMAAAREAGFPSLKAARAGGHPSGSEHTWTGSGAFEVGGPSDPSRTEPMGEPIAGADQVRREPKELDAGVVDQMHQGDPDLPGYSTPAPAASGDPELQDIVKLAGAPGGKHPDELGIGLAKDNRKGSKIDYSQEAQAARQRAKQDARADGGGREGGSNEKHGSGRYDDDTSKFTSGNLISDPVNIFGKTEKTTGPGDADNVKHGSGQYDDDKSKFTSGNLISKPKKIFTKAPKQGGRDN